MCKIVTNVNGIPYIPTLNVSVGDTTVNLVLGFREIQPVGIIVINLAK
jgi:hypothetical protein